MAVHPRVATTLEDLGRNVRDWRKIHGLTAELLAQRAGISRETLRALEHGTGTVRLESLVAVLAALDLDRDAERVARYRRRLAATLFT